MTDDARIRCLQRQPLQMADLEDRIRKPMPNLANNSNRSRIKRLPKIDADREFSHAALARKGSKSSVSAASMRPVLNTLVSFSIKEQIFLAVLHRPQRRHFL